MATGIRPRFSQEGPSSSDSEGRGIDCQKSTGLVCRVKRFIAPRPELFELLGDKQSYAVLFSSICLWIPGLYMFHLGFTFPAWMITIVMVTSVMADTFFRGGWWTMLDRFVATSCVLVACDYLLRTDSGSLFVNSIWAAIYAGGAVVLLLWSRASKTWEDWKYRHSIFHYWHVVLGLLMARRWIHYGILPHETTPLAFLLSQ